MPYQIVVDMDGVITPQPLEPGEGFHNAGQSTLLASTIGEIPNLWNQSEVSLEPGKHP